MYAMSTLSAVDLRTEYLVDPLAIARPTPRLMWRCASSTRGAVQTAYRIQAAGSPGDLTQEHNLLWDSGRIASSDTSAIWAGSTLGEFQDVRWRIQVWDEAGQVSAWSSAARFAMGPRSWSAASWISCPWSVSTNAPDFRRSFTTSRPVVDAKLHITARGIFSATLDGAAISDEVLAPGWTDYRQRLPYRSHDVTTLVAKPGEHVLAARLGEGWYKGPIGWEGQSQIWGGTTELLAILRLVHDDGSVTLVTTDGEWRVANSPVLASTFLRGELHDRGQARPGWDRPGFAATSWAAVRTKPIDAVPIEPHRAPPVRRLQEFTPVARWQIRPGVWILDLGQNIAGWVRLKVNAAAGTTIRLRHGEMVNPDRTLYVDNLRSALSTDYYTCAGSGVEEWEPQFTFHGFQYVEVSGWPGEPAGDAITGIAIGTDTPLTGAFNCSEPLLNQLYSNLVWTQRANYLEVPTDCPQRDERLGWTGDAQAFIRTGAWNADIASFFTKWHQDLRDAQSPDGIFPNIAPQIPGLGAQWGLSKGDVAWGDAGTVCPWTVWQVYDDRDQLADAYPAMVKWVNYLERTAQEGVHLRFHRDGQFIVFGDWLAVDCYTPQEVLMTAFFAHSTRLTAEAAEALGHTADATRLRTLHGKIRAAFIRAFVQPDGRVIGLRSPQATQTGQVLALHFNLLPDDLRAAATERLVELIAERDWHLSTGFVGLPYLLPVLSANGREDIAWRLLLTTTYPSWGYPITQGATTIWERWNGWKLGEGPADPGMNSYSHYSYGACGEWFFSDIAGIELLSPGFRRFRVRPRVNGPLTHATASHTCLHGLIRSAWKKEAGVLTWDVEVPVGTTAVIHVPTSHPASVRESGAPVTGAVTATEGFATLEVGAGIYHFTSTL